MQLKQNCKHMELRHLGNISDLLLINKIKLLMQLPVSNKLETVYVTFMRNCKKKRLMGGYNPPHFKLKKNTLNII